MDTCTSSGIASAIPIEVAAAQIPISWDLDENLAWIEKAIREAGAQILVLPEGAISGYDVELSRLDRAEPRAVDEAIETVAEVARQHGVEVFCGSLLYRAGAWSNAALHFSSTGRVGAYRKVNLAIGERGRLTAGDELPVFGIESGGESVAVGCQICREVRFPEQWHWLARRGVHVFAYLTHAVDPRAPEGVWRSHLISRAAETQRFVVSANVADPHQHCPTMIVSPRGEVAAEAEAGVPGLIRATIDLTAVADWYLDQQRGDVVEIKYRAQPTPRAETTARPTRSAPA